MVLSQNLIYRSINIPWHVKKHYYDNFYEPLRRFKWLQNKNNFTKITCSSVNLKEYNVPE